MMVVFPAVNLVLVNAGINRYAENGGAAQRKQPDRFVSISKSSRISRMTLLLLLTMKQSRV
jgi:hypothetical protein